MSMDKTTLVSLLERALSEQAQKRGDEIVYAAPLAVRIQELLRTKTGSPDLKLTGSLFGPILFPNLSPSEWSKLKFRDLLKAFPEKVEVFPTASGDRIRLLESHGLRPRNELAQFYQTLLIDGLQQLSEIRENDIVPLTQLGKWLLKQEPTFDVQKIGFSKLVDWLESLQNIVEVIDKDFGGKVTLLPSSTSKSSNLVDQAFLLVDSSDVLNEIHRLLGVRPNQNQLPDWSILLDYLRSRWPASNWKSLYFMALTESQFDTTEGFRAYLTAIGFTIPPPFLIESDQAGFDQTQKERSHATGLGVERTLALLPQKRGHVVVLTHSDRVSPNLKAILNSRKAGEVACVVCIPERLPRVISELEDKGLIVLDLEKDVKVFKQNLPRKVFSNTSAFDPSQFLD